MSIKKPKNQDIKNEVVEVTEGHIAILAGSLSDLSKINFSPWSLKCFHINDPGLSEYIRLHSSQEYHESNWDWVYDHSRTETHEKRLIFDCDKLYVLVPINPINPPKEGAYWDARTALLLVFPSELVIKNVHRYQVTDDKKINIVTSVKLSII